MSASSSSVTVEPLADSTLNDRPTATLTTSVYAQLRADILAGVLHPGDKLRADALRKRFDTGSSPVREALNRLLTEGFVSLEEQKGFRVTAISRDDLIELVGARVLIDSNAAAESIRRFEASWEEGLVLALHHLSRTPREAAASGGVTAWEARHKNFHAALVAGCGSRWICRISERLFDAAERYRLLALRWIPERNELDEHRTIVDACLARDERRVAELIRSHYGQTFDRIAASGLI